MKKLRLLITKECNRHCKGCCNKDWDLDNLPICMSFKEYNEVILTGGEPMLLETSALEMLIHIIRVQNPTTKIYMYSTDPFALDLPLDGVTLTLHDLNDTNRLKWYEESHCNVHPLCKSLRLNIFKGVPTYKFYLNWKIKKDIVWIKNCPLPKDEIIMRI